jgi:hypothetical protein
MSSHESGSKFRHDMKNQIGIILGFSELMLSEMAPDDPKRRDIREIHTAALRAMALLSPEAGQETHSND